MMKTYLDALPHFVIQRNKFLGVSITREIANSGLLVVASYLHAGSATIKSATIQWIGNFAFFGFIWNFQLVGCHIFKYLNLDGQLSLCNQCAGRLQLKWCVCSACKFSLLDQSVKHLPAGNSQWQSTIVVFANFLTMKGMLLDHNLFLL